MCQRCTEKTNNIPQRKADEYNILCNSCFQEIVKGKEKYTNKCIGNFNNLDQEGTIEFDCIQCNETVKHEYDQKVELLNPDSNWIDADFEPPFSYGFYCKNCDFGYFIETTEIVWSFRITKLRINADDYLKNKELKQ